MTTKQINKLFANDKRLEDRLNGQLELIEKLLYKVSVIEDFLREGLK